MTKKRIVVTLTIALLVLATLLIVQPGEAPDSPLPRRFDFDSPLVEIELTPRMLLPIIHGTPSEIKAHNLGFEGGRWYVTRWWWWPSIFAQTGAFAEIQPGEGWTAW